MSFKSPAQKWPISFIPGTVTLGDLVTDSVTLDQSNKDIKLSRRAANKLRLEAGDHLELDEVYLDADNRDIRLYRSGADILGLADNLQLPSAGKIITEAGDLELEPVGDLILDPTGNDVLPETDDDVNLGSATKEFKDLRVDGLAYVDGLGENLITTYWIGRGAADARLDFGTAAQIQPLDGNIVIPNNTALMAKDGVGATKDIVRLDAFTRLQLGTDASGGIYPNANIVIKAATLIDFSALAATSSHMSIVATSDAAPASWAGAAGIEVSEAPSGWMKVDVGGASRYIPFWT